MRQQQQAAAAVTGAAEEATPATVTAATPTAAAAETLRAILNKIALFDFDRLCSVLIASEGNTPSESAHFGYHCGTFS
jgi:hypothetical protein